MPFLFVKFLRAGKSWNVTKLAKMHNKDGGMKWSYIGDLDLVFKVTHYNDSKRI